MSHDGAKQNVPVLKNADQYGIWKYRMEMSLRKREVYDVIESQSALVGANAALQKRIHKAKALMVECLDDKHVLMVRNCENAFEMWKVLESRYEQQTPASKLFLRKKLHKHKPLPNESVDDCVARFTSLVDDLASKGVDVPEDEQVSILLYCWPSKFSTTVAALENIEDDLSVALIQTRLAQEELRINGISEESKEEETKATAFLSQNKAAMNPEKEKFIENCEKYCVCAANTHRGSQRGHYQNNQYQRGSYPNSRGRHQNFNNKNDSCYNCGRSGHFARECRSSRGNIHHRGWFSNNRGQPRGQVHRGYNHNYRGQSHTAVQRSSQIPRRQDPERIHTYEYHSNAPPPMNNTRPSSSQAFRARVLISGVTSQCTSDDRNRWYLDSGATHHMKSTKEGYIQYEELHPRGQVEIADGTVVDAVGVGTVTCYMFNGTESKLLHVCDVLHVPSLEKNLVSASVCTTKGKKITMENTNCVITDELGVIVAGFKDQFGMYLLKINTAHIEDITMQEAMKETAPCITSTSSTFTASHFTGKKMDLWHQRFGHLNIQSLRQMDTRNMVKGIDAKGESSFCNGCAEGKMHRLPFSSTGIRASKPLDLIHTDLCGELDIPASCGGSKYMMTLIDDATRYVTVYFLKHKSEAFEKFKIFEAEMTNKFHKKIKVLRSDRGGEFCSKEFSEFCQIKGIRRQLTTSYTPEQNGVAERGNRTVMESVRSMLLTAKMPKMFWAEAAATAVYVRNRSATKALKGKTPYEAWEGSKPNVKHLRIFGSSAFAHVPKEKRQKLDRKGEKCRMVGYSLQSKAYRLWSLEKRDIIERRDVIFDEGNFSNVPSVEIDDIFVPNESLGLRRSQRIQEKNKEDEVINHVAKCALSGGIIGDYPTNYADAMKRPDKEKWQEAAKAEFESLMENETWKLVDLPAGSPAITCRWVFTIKKKPDGTIDRYKARLVARGYSQMFGENYDETFSPVVNFTSVRTLLAIAAEKQMFVHQMDVTTAFLYGDVDGFDIYMHQPEGFEVKGKEHMVCKLERSLYGLKQAPRCWNKKLDHFLVENGFVKSEADPCIYKKIVGNEEILLAVYVDDLILAGSNFKVVQMIKEELSQRFKMKDLGQISHYLGLEIKQSPDRSKIFVTQENYVKKVLKKYGLENCRPAPTPMEVNLKLRKGEQLSKEVDKSTYQSCAGSLLFAALATRPDIAAAVSVVCRFNSNPQKEHWDAMKRIMAYLKNTSSQSIVFEKTQKSTSDLEIMAFADADWAGDLDDRKSTTGYLVKLANGPISWTSRKQPTVALSTTEAEYMALSNVTQEVAWLRFLLSTIGYGQRKPTVIGQDNQGCIFMSKNPMVHCRTKHIDIRHHFVRERIASEEIVLKYVPSGNMPADLMTKSLPRVRHQDLCKRVGLIDHKQFLD